MSDDIFPSKLNTAKEFKESAPDFYPEIINKKYDVYY
jgi:hypothetical protein